MNNKARAALMILVFILSACAPKAFEKFEIKTKTLLSSNSSTHNGYNPIDTIRITNLDSLVGSYSFQIGAYYSGNTIKLKKRGGFMERWFSDHLTLFVMMNARYGRWKFSNGRVILHYSGNKKTYEFIPLKFGRATFLVPNDGIQNFCNRIKQNQARLDTLMNGWNGMSKSYKRYYLSVLDSTTLYKIK